MANQSFLFIYSPCQITQQNREICQQNKLKGNGEINMANHCSSRLDGAMDYGFASCNKNIWPVGGKRVIL